MVISVTALFWVLLLSVKVLNGIVVLGKACEHVKHYRELQQKAESELFRKRVLTKKSKSVPSSPRLSLIDFSGKFASSRTKFSKYAMSHVMRQ